MYLKLAASKESPCRETDEAEVKENKNKNNRYLTPMETKLKLKRQQQEVFRQRKKNISPAIKVCKVTRIQSVIFFGRNSFRRSSSEEKTWQR